MNWRHKWKDIYVLGLGKSLKYPLEKLIKIPPQMTCRFNAITIKNDIFHINLKKNPRIHMEWKTNSNIQIDDFEQKTKLWLYMASKYNAML